MTEALALPKRWPRRAEEAFSFPLFVVRRFTADACLRVAASLSYTCLLALVPLLTIALAILSAFPVFSDIEAMLRKELVGMVAPAVGDAIHGHVERFVSNTRQLTGVGIAALGVTAVLLLVTVEEALNRIFRVKRKRRFVFRFMTYWAIITLTPLFVAVSVSLTGQLQGMIGVLGLGEGTATSGFVSHVLWRQFVPWVLQVAAFTVFFIVIPNRRVEFIHALSGAVVASFLFQVLKWAFALYVRGGPAAETIYGALATVPLFLIWMYLSWAVILIGAEVSASVSEWRIEQMAARDAASRESHLLARALAVLAALRDTYRRGRAPATVAVAASAGLSRGVAEQTLETLQEVGWATRLAAGTWQPARDLAAVTVYDLCQALGLALPHDAAGRLGGSAAWRQGLEPALAEARAGAEQALGMSVADLIDGRKEA